MSEKIINFFYHIYKRTGIYGAPPGTFLFRLNISIYSIYKRLRKPPQSAQENSVRLLVLCGIGDALWSFSLIPPLLKKLNKRKVDLVVHYNGDHRAGRSFELLKRFSFVNSVTPYSWQIHRSPPVDKHGYLQYTISARPAKNATEKFFFDYSLIVNTYLEKGFTFPEICKELDLDSDLIEYDVFKYYKCTKDDTLALTKLKQYSDRYIVAYFGALSDNTTQGLNYQGLWSPDDWAELLTEVHKRTKLKIVLVGAPYDAAYLHPFMKAFGGNFYDVFINNIGVSDFTNTLEILRNAEFVLGFASGLTISSTYLGTKTGIFWRPQNISMSPDLERFGFHKGFATDWVDPKFLADGTYLDFWYTKDTPHSILNRLEENGWIK